MRPVTAVAEAVGSSRPRPRGRLWRAPRAPPPPLVLSAAKAAYSNKIASSMLAAAAARRFGGARGAGRITLRASACRPRGRCAGRPAACRAAGRTRGGGGARPRCPPVSCSLRSPCEGARPRPTPTPGAVGRCEHARPAARPPSTPRPFLALSHLPRRLQAASSNSFLPTLSHRTLPSRPPLGVGAGGRAACDSSRRGSGIFEAKTARAAMARAARAAAPSRPLRRQGCLQH